MFYKLSVLRSEVNTGFLLLCCKLYLSSAESSYTGVENIRRIYDSLRLASTLFLLQHKCLILPILYRLLHHLGVHLDRYVKLLGYVVKNLRISAVSPHGVHSLLGTLSRVSETQRVQSCL